LPEIHPAALNAFGRPMRIRKPAKDAITLLFRAALVNKRITCHIPEHGNSDLVIIMDNKPWHIYVGEIPYSEKGTFWVSFESDPYLKRTKANIYGRCLPCIQHLYSQLKEEAAEIDLGNAFHCWKVTTVLNGIDECLSLLSEFEKRFPEGHVYGKLGTGRPLSETKVVVFHTEDEATGEQVRRRVEACLPTVNEDAEVVVSRACAVLYGEILGDWRGWLPVTPIKHPERAGALLERIRKALFWSVV
jgi:hypothetical protein